MACPFLLAGFDPRQVGALPRRLRLPSSRATGAAFFAEIVHRTISDRSSPPGQARPDYRRQEGWLPCPALARRALSPDDLPPADRPGGPHPLACVLKPSGNRTVKTLHRSVFRQSSGRAVTSLAARFPERFSPIVFGLHPVTPTPARHKTALQCFHQSSSCSGSRVLRLTVRQSSGSSPARRPAPCRLHPSAPPRAGGGPSRRRLCGRPPGRCPPARGRTLTGRAHGCPNSP
jgi:hypothetical protein